MTPDAERVAAVLRAVAHEVRAERVTFMAGSIAYNAFVSMLPLLLLLLSVVSALGNEQLETTLLSITNAAVNPGAGRVLVEEVQHASTEVSLLGGAFLVWGALRIFRSLDAAFSDIYETSAENTFADQVVDGLLVFASVTLVVVVAITLEVQFATTPTSGVAWLVHRVSLVVGVAAALVPMYYLFPDEPDVGLVEVLPGVAVTATGLVLFQSLFQLYLQFSSTAARNSILASILVFMTWLYFSGLIVLVGAAVNAVLSNRSADVDIEPVLGGVEPTSERTTATVDADDLDAVRRLAELLPGAGEVQVVADGESVPLPVPVRVAADLETTGLPLGERTVGIELSWTVADGSEAPTEDEGGGEDAAHREDDAGVSADRVE